jgi:hypothetical protein
MVNTQGGGGFSEAGAVAAKKRPSMRPAHQDFRFPISDFRFPISDFRFGESGWHTLTHPVALARGATVGGATQSVEDSGDLAGYCRFALAEQAAGQVQYD